jgi:hypothetical protein
MERWRCEARANTGGGRCSGVALGTSGFAEVSDMVTTRAMRRKHFHAAARKHKFISCIETAKQSGSLFFFLHRLRFPQTQWLATHNATA